MRLLKLVPDSTDIQFINKRLIAFAFSGFLVLGSMGLLLGPGLNLGIDFLGGILIEARTEGPANIGQLRSELGGLGLGELAGVLPGKGDSMFGVDGEFIHLFGKDSLRGHEAVAA